MCCLHGCWASVTGNTFLDAFTKLQKATVSFNMSVRPSVCSYETTRLPLDGFSWHWYLRVILKICQEIQVLLKSDKNDVYCIWSTMCMYDSMSLFQTKLLEKIKTYSLCSITFFQKSWHLWDKVGKSGRARQTTDDSIYWNETELNLIVQCVFFTWWITKATDTHKMCNTYRFSAATVVTWTRLNITLYVHFLVCLTCFYDWVTHAEFVHISDAF